MFNTHSGSHSLHHTNISVVVTERPLSPRSSALTFHWLGKGHVEQEERNGWRVEVGDRRKETTSTAGLQKQKRGVVGPGYHRNICVRATCCISSSLSTSFLLAFQQVNIDVMMLFMVRSHHMARRMRTYIQHSSSTRNKLGERPKN